MDLMLAEQLYRAGLELASGLPLGLIAYGRSTLVTSEKYIGLDVHQATISVAVGFQRQAGDGIDSRPEPQPYCSF